MPVNMLFRKSALILTCLKHACVIVSECPITQFCLTCRRVYVRIGHQTVVDLHLNWFSTEGGLSSREAGSSEVVQLFNDLVDLPPRNIHFLGLSERVA